LGDLVRCDVQEFVGIVLLAVEKTIGDACLAYRLLTHQV